MNPALQLDKESVAPEARTAGLLLQLANYQFDLYQYLPDGLKPAELAEKFQTIYDQLPVDSPDKSEALACHAYATFWRFVGEGDLAKSTSAEVKKEAWQKMTRNAVTATKANPSPYLAHLTLATAGGLEFRALMGIKMNLKLI